MGIGFDHECADVSRRIQAQATANGTHPSITRLAVFDAVRLLSRYATRLHRSYEAACNREQSPAELRVETDTEARVLALCHRLGVSVRFNGDPRGAPVQIPCAKENANGFAGDVIVIPYGSHAEYERSYAREQALQAKLARERAATESVVDRWFPKTEATNG